MREAAQAVLVLAFFALGLLAIAAGIIGAIWPAEPQMAIDATPAQARDCGAPDPPTYRPAPIPVQPSDARRIV